MQKIIKTIFSIFLILFLLLYLNRSNNYYYYQNNKVLSDEAIIQFEQDLKDGKEINPSNYITPEKNYNNKASTLGLKSSIFIEKIVNKLLKKLLNYIEH